MVTDADQDVVTQACVILDECETERPISAVLADLRETLPDDRVCIRDVADALGNHCFGSAVFLLSIPVLLPIPLGISIFFALPILVYTGRVIFGAPADHLPGWVDRQWVRSDLARGMLDRIVPRLRTIEPWLRPRWRFLVGNAAEPLLALICFVLAVVAVIPLPLTGWLPGFAMLTIGLGLVYRDGIAVLLGLVVGAVSVIVLVAMVITLVVAGRMLLSSHVPVA